MRIRAFVLCLGLLLAVGSHRLPAIGIDPQAAVGGSFAVAFGFVILISLADRLSPRHTPHSKGHGTPC